MSEQRLFLGLVVSAVGVQDMENLEASYASGYSKLKKKWKKRKKERKKLRK